MKTISAKREKTFYAVSLIGFIVGLALAFYGYSNSMYILAGLGDGLVVATVVASVSYQFRKKKVSQSTS